MTSLELRLAPIDDDPTEVGRESGIPRWRAKSVDPKFVASLPNGASPLPTGWYTATAVLRGSNGDIRDPQLYLPDTAGQYSELRSIKMLRRGARYTADFYAPDPIDHLRFDPSTAPCEFTCESLQVARLAAAPRPSPPGAARQGWTARLASWLAGGGPPSPQSRAPRVSPSENRKRRVLEMIDRGGAGIEIGPSHDPIAPKREGFKVHVIDHASREELLGKYRNHPVRHENIEEVDFVWKGQSYLELTGRPHHYDWVIASNVVEHTPDLIAFLADCDSILRDGGVLVLVVPDKRYCFDRFRPITGLSKVIDSHVARHRVHSPGAVAEYFMNVVLREGRHSWQAGDEGEYVLRHTPAEAVRAIQEVQERGSYLDIHNWCFVPHSFRLLLDDLHALGYTKLREVGFRATEGYEFFVTLGRHGLGPDLSRLEMLRAIDAELAEAEPIRS